MTNICGGVIQPGFNFHLSSLLSAMSPSLKEQQAFWKEGSIQLGCSGGQIVSNVEKDIVLLKDGEIYLESNGRCIPITDEDIIDIYLEKGVDAFTTFFGAFAIAIYDNVKKQLILARDRFGEKPLYWTNLNNTFLFASQLKGLLASPTVFSHPDFESIAYFFAFGFIPSDRSLVEKIRKVHPASYLIYFDKVNHYSRSYWSLSDNLLAKNEKWEVSNYIKTRNAIIKDRFKENKTAFLLRDAGEKYALGDYDGTRLHPQMVPLSLYEKENKKNSLNHHSLNFAEALNQMPQILWHLDEPLADFSVFSFWHLCQLAKKNQFSQIATATGSFPYLSHHIHHPECKHQKSKTWLPLLSRKILLSPPLVKMQPNFIFFLLRKLNIPSWHSLYLNNQFFNDPNLLKKWIFKDRLSLDMQAFLYSFPRLEELGKTLSSLLFLYFRFYMPNNDLIIEDRLSRAAKLNKKSLFLDHRLIENISSMPERIPHRKKDAFSLNDLIQPMELPKFKTELLPESFLKEKDLLYAYFSSLPSGILAKSQLISPKTFSYLFNHWQNPSVFRLLWSILILETWFQVFHERKQPGVLPAATLKDIFL
ncbi:MAG: hypothetical protein Tsb0015_09260 [Simkaniaceae bacterium]